VHFKKILLYGVKTWTGTNREGSKIEALKMKFLRAIMGKTKKERNINAHITEELRMEDTHNYLFF
jgi:hypothetical protein